LDPFEVGIKVLVSQNRAHILWPYRGYQFDVSYLAQALTNVMPISLLTIQAHGTPVQMGKDTFAYGRAEFVKNKFDDPNLDLEKQRRMPWKQLGSLFVKGASVRLVSCCVGSMDTPTWNWSRINVAMHLTSIWPPYTLVHAPKQTTHYNGMKWDYKNNVAVETIKPDVDTRAIEMIRYIKCLEIAPEKVPEESWWIFRIRDHAISRLQTEAKISPLKLVKEAGDDDLMFVTGQAPSFLVSNRELAKAKNNLQFCSVLLLLKKKQGDLGEAVFPLIKPLKILVKPGAERLAEADLVSPVKAPSVQKHTFIKRRDRRRIRDQRNQLRSRREGN